jgi:hypothetical protein
MIDWRSKGGGAAGWFLSDLLSGSCATWDSSDRGGLQLERGLPSRLRVKGQSCFYPRALLRPGLQPARGRNVPSACAYTDGAVLFFRKGESVVYARKWPAHFTRYSSFACCPDGLDTLATTSEVPIPSVPAEPFVRINDLDRVLTSVAVAMSNALRGAAHVSTRGPICEDRN